MEKIGEDQSKGYMERGRGEKCLRAYRQNIFRI